MKWTTLEHNGVAFPPPYPPRGLSIQVQGEAVHLTPEQEEMAYAWCKKKDTSYFQDPVFASNFLSDFLKLFPAAYADASIRDFDFSNIIRLQEGEKQALSDPTVKKNLAAERKQMRLKLREQFGYAAINGRRSEVANWMVEPPGTFIGRGNHPQRGRWKPRVYSQDVTLNLGEDAPVPPGSWGRILHDHDSMWLACWTDKLSKVIKYVWLSDGSSLRQQRDRLKYDTAAKLTKVIARVREFIRKRMVAKDEKTRKIATVCYLIDKLSMRVGDEKDEDEADTVGASTLRIEHIHLAPDSVNFDFLGKDSVRWQKSVAVENADKTILENLHAFSEGKTKTALLFDGINSSSVNRFLGKAARGLTAKVFRTYHATNTVRDYLAQHDQFPAGASEFVRLYQARLANLEAAITCNHKRTPPKNWAESLAKKEQALAQLIGQDPKTERAAQRLVQRTEKLRLTIDLVKRTRDYNLNTSLRNYLDPRVYRAWSHHVGLDWTRIYSKSLQKKFGWVTRARLVWP